MERNDVSCKKKYDKIKFKNLSNEKYIENNDELKIIGQDIINILKDNISNKNLFFADICGAPGNYSKLILKNFKSTGIGISLPIIKSGVKFEMDDFDNYKIIYEDILKKDYEIDIQKKLNLGIASCVTYEVSP